MKKVLVAVAAAMLAIAGCEYNVYTVEMTVDGDVVTRAVDARRSGATSQEAPRPSDDANLVLAPYGATATSLPAKGSFAGRTPNDIGGAGRIAHFETSLGECWGYIERTRGNTEPAAEVEERLQTIDRGIDIWAQFIHEWLGKHAEAARIEAFIRTEFRKDLRNLAMMAWTGAALESLDVGEAAKVRDVQNTLSAATVQFLLEKDYLTAKDAPTIWRVFEGSDEEGAKRLLRGMVDRKLAIKDTKLADRLVEAMATPPDDAKKVLARVIQRQADFKAWRPGEIARLENEAKAASQPFEAPKEEDLAWNYLKSRANLDEALGSFFGGSMRTEDQAAFSLETDTQPVTNGQWNPETGKVTWGFSINARNKRAQGLAKTLYAIWAKPRREAQVKAFGRVAMEGVDLTQYCVWRNSLDASEAAEWEAMIATLRPATALETLNAFGKKHGIKEPQTQPVTQPLESPATGSASQPASQPTSQQIRDQWLGKGIRLLESAIQGHSTQPTTEPGAAEDK